MTTSNVKEGVLLSCDASIKAMLVKIDSENNSEYIIEDLDDEHLLVKSGKEEELKLKLKERIKDTVREPEESESE